MGKTRDEIHALFADAIRFAHDQMDDSEYRAKADELTKE